MKKSIVIAAALVLTFAMATYVLFANAANIETEDTVEREQWEYCILESNRFNFRVFINGNWSDFYDGSINYGSF